jgi:hypothetical protein
LLLLIRIRKGDAHSRHKGGRVYACRAKNYGLGMT